MVDMTSHSVPEEYARMLVFLHAAGAAVWSACQASADPSSIWPVFLFVAVALRGLGPVGSGLYRDLSTAGLVTALVATSIALRANGETGVLSTVLSVLLAAKLLAEKLHNISIEDQRG